MAFFPDDRGSAGFSSGPPPPPVLWREPLGLVQRVFYRPDVLPVTQPSVSKHWREHKAITLTSGLASSSLFWRNGHCPLYASFRCRESWKMAVEMFVSMWVEFVALQSLRSESASSSGDRRASPQLTRPQSGRSRHNQTMPPTHSSDQRVPANEYQTRTTWSSSSASDARQVSMPRHLSWMFPFCALRGRKSSL